MRISLIIAVVVAAALFVKPAQAAVTISNVATGNGSESLFGTDIVQEGADGEIIRLDLNSFLAMDSAIGITPPVTAIDTVSLTVTAPENFLITSVTYREAGTILMTASSSASLSGAITVDGSPFNFHPQSFIGEMDDDWLLAPVPIALLGGAESVNISVTNSLSALAFEPGASSTITKTDAVLEIGISAVPEPTSALFLCGVGAIVSLRRRRRVA